MTDRAHEAFLGVTVDHLYENCPGLWQANKVSCCCEHHNDYLVGDRAVTMVDPLGTDVCGWCVRKWKGKQNAS